MSSHTPAMQPATMEMEVHMHEEVMFFCKNQIQAYPDSIRRVLDVGSFDMNGSTRGLFPRGAEYIGIDIHEGKGVDWVGPAHEYAGKGWDGRLFDAMISTECLEHDPHWAQTIRSCCQLVRPGGLILMTCASNPRPPHALHLWPDGYYRNLEPDDVLPAFRDAAVRGNARKVRGGEDLQFSGIREGALECMDATGFDYELRDEVSTGHMANADGRVWVLSLVVGEKKIVGRGPSASAAADQAIFALALGKHLGRT